MTAELFFIGEINTPYQTKEACPGQARPQNGTSRITVDPAYASALDDLEVGGRIQVLYWFDQADRGVLKTVPKWSETNEERGVFSTRSPNRPNPIALSAVEIVAINGNSLTVTALDCIDGTPLLDIKPYIAHLKS